MSFTALVDEAVQDARQLLELLALEREAVESGSAADIEAIATRKQLSVERLERTASAMRRLLEARGKTWNQTDLVAVLNSETGAGAIAARSDSGRSQELLDLLEECRTQNLINGQITASSRRYVEQALALLSGALPNEGEGVYDARGGSSTTGRPPGRIGKA